MALSSLRSLHPKLASQILARIGGEEEFFCLSKQQLAAAVGFNNRLFDADLRAKALAEAEREYQFLSRNNIRPLYFTDADYPQRLLECDDAPLMLYGLGDCNLNDARFISIVGTRHATAYGSAFVEDLVSALAREVEGKVVVVSGLALGIDVAAHRAALRAGLPTVGVLAHGLNTIYPAGHRSIAGEMVHSGGALLTEYRSIDSIHRGNFLARNRIVAGMCDCLVVAESDVKGGALVTARLAADYSRDVFALPGRTSDRFSRGCNALISSNVAHLVTGADDIIDLMRWPRRAQEGTQTSLFIELSDEEQRIIDVISARGEASLSEMSAQILVPPHRLMGTLIDMEFRGLILNLPGGRYRIK